MATRTFNTEELVYVSKFKVGDWVQFIDSDSTKYFGRCLDIRDTYHSDYGEITVVDVDWTDVGYFIQDIEPWQPQEGEWVCSIKDTDSFEVYKYKSHPNPKTCQPFIGTLPTFLSGK